ncbi:unnamed protein product [Callosobruchus maculatus]|uniref:Uncharacterized protein n=1 Tax=Callosobruchus maculatus TaxID=64391 RepID=A0A653CCZ4_CALMS|nr:unnamed protein product [Callosobruchus maculatus]
MQLNVLCLFFFGYCLDLVLSDYRNHQNVKGPVIIRKKSHHTVYKQIYPDKVPQEEEQLEQISKDDLKRKRKVVKKPKSNHDHTPKKENKYEWVRESNKNEIMVTPEKTQTVETDDKGYQTVSKVITKEHVEVQEINPLAAFPSDRVVVKGSYKVHETDPNMQTTSTVHNYDSPTGKVIAEILTELDQIRRVPDENKSLKAEGSSYVPFQREKEFESLFDFDPFKDEKETENEFGFEPFESRAKKVQFEDFFDASEEDESRDEARKRPYTTFQQRRLAENRNRIEDNDYVESTNYEEPPSDKEEMITPFPKIHFDYPRDSRSRSSDSYSQSSFNEEPSRQDEMITLFPKVHFDYPRMSFDHPKLSERRLRFEPPQEAESRTHLDFPDESESQIITITPKAEEQYHYEYDFAGKGQANKRMAPKLMRAEDHHLPYDYAKREAKPVTKEEVKPKEEEEEYDSEAHDKTEETKEKEVEAATPKIEDNPHAVHELAKSQANDEKMKMTKLKQEEYDDHFDFLKHDDEDCPYERLKGSETSSFENDALEKYVIYKIYGPLYNSEHEH